MWWVVGLVVAGVAALGLAILPHNLRVRRVRRACAALPPDLRRQVLARIAAAAVPKPAFTLMVPAVRPAGDVCGSRMGGAPFAEAGEVWPVAAAAVADFLIQVRLSDSGLGPTWQGRLLTVFLLDYSELIVRGHPLPEPDRHRPLAGGFMRGEPLELEDLPIPLPPPAAEDDEAPFAGSPRALIAAVPELAALLAPYGEAHGLLAQILYPGRYGYDLDGSDAAFQGGSPELIQDPHEASCPACRRPMRFLFQFGDFVPGVQLGDAGVGYVYGCDDHPDRLEGFVDSH